MFCLGQNNINPKVAIYLTLPILVTALGCGTLAGGAKEQQQSSCPYGHNCAGPITSSFRGLTGSWLLQLQVDSGAQSAEKLVIGDLSLRREDGSPVYTGDHSLPVHLLLGYSLRKEVSALVISSDSICVSLGAAEVLVDPGFDQFDRGIDLAGQIYHDSVAGSWWARTSDALPRGRFSMKRRTEEGEGSIMIARPRSLVCRGYNQLR